MSPVISVQSAGVPGAEGAVHVIAFDPSTWLSGVALVVHPEEPEALRRGHLAALAKLQLAQELVRRHAPACGPRQADKESN